ncbi:FxSxx-COOH system tetratricopeptide repeat protein [Streptomyces sp. NPDC051018]|uniref:FxSxx-COOH system tetratricopeptide repeat protein n=1 Tax=Streptomyces sp. NPDC051018 TaxID=3365639 RepID=UPI0037B71828
MEQVPERLDFYISYHPADQAWAEWAAWQLEQNGYRTMVQDWDLRPGDNLVERKNDALQRCHHALAVVTVAYLASPVSRDEWTAAFLDDSGAAERLICLRVEDCELPLVLRARKHIDLADCDEGQAVTALLRGVAERSARPERAPAFPRAVHRAPEGPRFPAEPPRIFRVPPRNPNFTGRLGTLRRIAAQLDDSATVVQAALHGLGGIGKTQIAIEYAHRHATSYDLVWWVAAEQPAVLAADLAALAGELGIGVAGGRRSQVEALFAALARLGRWLIVFDNAEEPEALYPLPQGGHVLVTSRNPNWGGVAAPVPLDVLTRQEAMIFLAKRIADSSDEDRGNLATRLGFLPLALEQAAAFVEATQITVAEYLDLLASSAADAFPTRPPLGYSQTVANTWMLSLDRIHEKSPDAYGLLLFCSVLAPDGVPRRILRESAPSLPAPLSATVSSPPRYYAAVQALRRFSMVNATPESLSMHRLVQWIVRRRAEGTDRPPAAVAADAVAWLLQVFPADSGEPRSMTVCERLLPHVLAVRHLAAPQGAAGRDLAALLDRAAVFLHARAALETAEDLFEAAYRIRRSPDLRGEPGGEENLLRTRIGYARLLQDLGRTAQARLTFEEVEGTLRADDSSAPSPLLVTALIDMGRLLQEEGDLRGAKERLTEALSHAHATDVPVEVLAKAHGILGRVEQDQGNIGRARDRFRRALVLSTEAFGEGDSRVALRRNSLAGALHLGGETARAREELESALATLESVYGEDHDRTVAVRINLGAALHVRGDHGAARRQYEQADRICARLGLAGDPRVAMIRTGLGNLLHDDGDLPRALVQHRGALAAGRDLYDDSHPRMVVIASNAGACLERVGDLGESAALLETALRSATRLYGADHPRVAAIRNARGVLLGRGDDPGAARAELLRARETTVRVYGSGHSRAAVIENNLGVLASAAGPGDHAGEHFARALGIAVAAYGPDHPRTAVIRANGTGRREPESMEPSGAPVPLYIPLHIHQQATTIDR